MPAWRRCTQRLVLKPPRRLSAAWTKRGSPMRLQVIVLALITALNSIALAEDAAPRKRIRFGIQTAQQEVEFQQLVTVWQQADALGFDTAFVFDHFMPILGSDTDGSCLEGWTLLTALAAQTRHLKVGT